jgi:hypothetical protein
MLNRIASTAGILALAICSSSNAQGTIHCTTFGNTTSCNSEGFQSPGPPSPVYVVPQQSPVDFVLSLARAREAQAQANLAEAQTRALEDATQERETTRAQAAQAEFARQQAERQAQAETERKANAAAALADQQTRAELKASAEHTASREKTDVLIDGIAKLDERCKTSHDINTCDAAQAYREELRFRRLTNSE